jgi:hypothetical protein
VNRRPILGLVVFGLLAAACAPMPVSSGDPSASGAAPSVSASPSLPSGPVPSVPLTPTPSIAGTPGPTPLVPANALLPNLVMEPLHEWTVEYNDEGRRLLRVTTIFSNYGVGPFELLGSRADRGQAFMSMTQVVHLAGGATVDVPTPVHAEYAGDGHEHWHTQRAVTMELSPVLDPGTVRYGSKIDFCFFDNIRTNEAIRGSPSRAFYRFAWCGEPDDLEVRMGLSLGWGDRYQWDFVYQWIDITGMAGGTYQLRATVDKPNDFLETDDTDNCTISRIQIPAAGEGQIIVVEDNEVPCTSDPGPVQTP